jgi:hypothetical protein
MEAPSDVYQLSIYRDGIVDVNGQYDNGVLRHGFVK